MRSVYEVEEIDGSVVHRIDSPKALMKYTRHVREQARMEERAAIVAWLREGVRGEWFPGLADAIEAGEHLK